MRSLAENIARIRAAREAGDAQLAGMGRVFHADTRLTLGAKGVAQTPLRETASGLSGDEIPIAVVGAHLSGMALNGELKALGQLAAGNVQVGEDIVRLEVTLPWLLHKFGEVVQRTIASQAQILLEKK